MTGRLRHRSLSEVMGSWPFQATGKIGPQGPVSPGQFFEVPRALSPRAKLVGIVREVAAGYDVGGKSFDLWVDGNSPAITVSFPTTGGNYTLQEVIDEINGDTVGVLGADVAFNENNFLKLESPTDGDGSYLRIETNSASGSAVLTVLGLFAETEAYAGDIAPAQSIDPDRQVATPGQLSLNHGEEFESNVFNRIAYQMATSTDRVYNLMAKKRLAVKKEYEFTYATGGIDLSGTGIVTYTGPDTFTNPPTEAELEHLFAVLDEYGEEITVEEESALGAQSTDVDLTYNTYYQAYLVKDNTPNWEAGAAGDANVEKYVKFTDLATNPAFNDVPLKIIGYDSLTSSYIIQDVHPDTGARISGDESGRTGDKILVTAKKANVAATLDAPAGSNIWNTQSTKTAASTVTRVDLNNRIYVSGADFVTDAVAEGDIVEWSGHSETVPYSNDATYRVARVIDAETLELVTEDYEPVYLNPVVGTGFGDVTVKTDGSFWKEPFLELGDVEPPNGATVKLVYLGQTNFLDASTDPAFLAGPSVKYTQESSTSVQQALLNIVGPSATHFTDVLYPTDNLTNMSLERLNFRLNKEHYDEGGRHKVIQPDKIDMFHDTIPPGGYTGERIVAYEVSSEATYSPKVVLKDVGNLAKWSLGKGGRNVISPSGLPTAGDSPPNSSFNPLIVGWDDTDPSMALLGYAGADATLFLGSGNGASPGQSNVTASVDTDTLGNILFMGATSGEYIRSSLIRAVQDGASGATYAPSKLEFYSSTDTARDNVLTLTSDGKALVGASALEYGTLSVDGAVVAANSKSSGYTWINAAGSTVDGRMYLDANNDLSIESGAGGHLFLYGNNEDIGDGDTFEFDFDTATFVIKEDSGQTKLPALKFESTDSDTIFYLNDANDTFLRLAAGNDFLIRQNDDSTIAEFDVDGLKITGRTQITNSTSEPVALNVIDQRELGGTPGDYLGLTKISTETSNTVRMETWSRRWNPGSDWYSMSIRTGISIDSSFDTPGTSKCWDDRIPNLGAFGWGNGSETYATLDASKLTLLAGTSNLELFAQSGTTQINASNSSLTLHTDDIERLRLTFQGQAIFGNNTTADTMVGGATYYSTGASGNVLSFRHSAVGHGLTGEGVETDAYGQARPLSLGASVAGGLGLDGFREGTGEAAVAITATTNATEDISPDTSSTGVVTVIARRNDVGSFARFSPGAPRVNLMTIRDDDATRFVFQANGSMYYDGTDNPLAFDDEQDAVACRDLSYVLGNSPSDVLAYHQEDLERVGVMSNGFVSLKDLHGLMLGGIGEMYGVFELLLGKLNETLGIDLTYEDLRKELRGLA